MRLRIKGFGSSRKRSAALARPRAAPTSVQVQRKGWCYYTCCVNTSLQMFMIYFGKCLADETGAMWKLKHVAVCKLFGPEACKPPLLCLEFGVLDILEDYKYFLEERQLKVKHSAFDVLVSGY